MNVKSFLFSTATACAVAGVIALVAPTTVGAATATSNIAVSASVAANCTIATTAIDFGSYEPVVANASAPLDASGKVTVACTKNALVKIGLGYGSHAAGTTRNLASSSATMTYELYQDSAHATVWGPIGAGHVAPAAAPDKAPRDFTIYARILGGIDVPAGSFSDTVLATVEF
jgi:spore coat protein U-like protein